jgi:hypothetical protein
MIEEAACRVDPELFARGCGATVPAALRLCRHCPRAEAAWCARDVERHWRAFIGSLRDGPDCE